MSSVDSRVNKDKEEMLVFGYECKLFRDDEKADWIDSKQHLVPWNGNKGLMIDRFDVRGLLMDQRDFDADFVPNDRRSFFTPEEAGIEKLCEEERYLALNKDLQAEKEREEEEWKRYQEALQEGFHAMGHEYETKVYDPMDPTEDDFPETFNVDEHVNAVTVSHISKEEQKYNQVAPPPPPEETSGVEAASSEEASNPYVIPKGLIIPHDMQLPESAKHGVIIEKTAQLVASQGAQMEVLLKTKQANNSSFNFLNYNSVLHPFYLFILTMIKSRRYVPQTLEQPPNQTQNSSMPASLYQHQSDSNAAKNNLNNQGASTVPTAKAAPKASVVIHHSDEDSSSSSDSDTDSDSDSSAGGYLHPLLAGASLSPVVASSKDEDTQSQSSSQKTEEKPDVKITTSKEKPPSPVPQPKIQNDLERQKRNAMMQNCHHQAMTRLYYDGLSHIPVVPPPPDTQPDVDKVAREVALHSKPEEYEDSLRQMYVAEINNQEINPKPPSKSFLWPQDPNHVYYRFKKYLFRECMTVFGCADPEEELKKREEAIRELEKKKALAVAKARKRNNPGPVKFSLSPAAKKSKSSESSGLKLVKGESALPYESSDSGEENEIAAAENILQDEEKSVNKEVTGSSKFNAKEADQNSSSENGASTSTQQDPDAAIRAMTAFLSELEAKNRDVNENNEETRSQSNASSENSDTTPMSKYEKSLQAERKRKASMFLQRLKQNENKNSNNPSNDTEKSKDSEICDTATNGEQVKTSKSVSEKG